MKFIHIPMSAKKIEQWIKNNEDIVGQYCVWLDYQIGFSGIGTTSLDQEPDFDMPKNIPDEVKQTLIDEGKKWAKIKWDSWCKSVLEVTGEDTMGEWECPKIG